MSASNTNVENIRVLVKKSSVLLGLCENGSYLHGGGVGGYPCCSWDVVEVVGTAEVACDEVSVVGNVISGRISSFVLYKIINTNK